MYLWFVVIMYSVVKKLHHSTYKLNTSHNLLISSHLRLRAKISVNLSTVAKSFPIQFNFSAHVNNKKRLTGTDAETSTLLGMLFEDRLSRTRVDF